MRRAIESIRDELKERLEALSQQGKLLERQRLEQRTMYDLESIEQMGFCSGIENYSRHLTGRTAGEPPPTLMDYFPDDYLLIVDESHQTVPQIGAMYNGDRSRKETLVEFGFRLPSALDNRPLQFDEWRQRAQADDLRLGDAGRLGARRRPRASSSSRSSGRPGLLDPEVEVRPVAHQVDDLLAEIRERTSQRRQGPRHHADQAHGRGSDRVLPRDRRARSATSTPTSTRSSASRSSAICGAASSTCSSASTCCAKASTSPRCRSSASSTPTRRASCAASAR